MPPFPIRWFKLHHISERRMDASACTMQISFLHLYHMTTRKARGRGSSGGFIAGASTFFENRPAIFEMWRNGG